MKKNENNQLCWSCAKCTNGNLCSWVKNITLPDGTIRNNKGIITSCPNYEYDKITDIRTDEQKAKDMGLTLNQYNYYKKTKYNYKLFINLYEKYGIKELSKILNIKEKQAIDYKNKRFKVPCRLYKKLKELKDD